jgi:hypothetical protein
MIEILHVPILKKDPPFFFNMCFQQKKTVFFPSGQRWKKNPAIWLLNPKTAFLGIFK